MHKLIRLLALPLFIAGFLTSARAAVETYEIDPVHSSIGFTIRHFVSKVPGSFTQFRGTITVDRDNPANNAIDATVDMGSIDTRSGKRDDHLKSADFFDATRYATATFQSKAWKQTGKDAFDVTGDLTLHGVTKEIVLQVKLLGFGPGMRPGSMLSGWEASTTLMKSDFGVTGPAMLGKVLGDEVNVNIAIEAGLRS